MERHPDLGDPESSVRVDLILQTEKAKENAARIVALRAADQLAIAHDMLSAVRTWLEGQISFRGSHKQYETLVDAMNSWVVKITGVLEKKGMKDIEFEPPVDTELKRVQDEVLEGLPVTPERTPEIGDIVLTLLELPGLMGHKKQVTMAAMVTILSDEDPSKIGLSIFPGINSGLPGIGQIWAEYSPEPKLGHWRWKK